MDLRLDATPEELPVFIAETDEMLQMLDEQLVQLEQHGPSPELLQEVFRAAHTIKGSSAAIGHLRMAKLTHAMETLLDKVRHGEISTTPMLTELLFQGLDMLKVLAGEVQTLELTENLDIDGLVAKLEALANNKELALAGHETVRPSAIDSPVGTSHHLVVKFEVADWAAVRAYQVLLAVDDLGTVLVSNPSRSEIVAQKINERLEVFFGTSKSVDEVRYAVSTVPEVEILELVYADEMPVAPAPVLDVAPSAAAAARPVADASPADAEAAGVAGARKGPARAGSATVRIDVERLDRLLNLVGELVIDRTRLLGLGKMLQDELGEHSLLSDITETTFHLGRVTDELQSEVMKSRMLPIGTVFSRFPRVTRDLATRQQKKVGSPGTELEFAL